MLVTAANLGLRDIAAGIMAAATYCAATARHALLPICRHFIRPCSAVQDDRCAQVCVLSCCDRAGDGVQWETPLT